MHDDSGGGGLAAPLPTLARLQGRGLVEHYRIGEIATNGHGVNTTLVSNWPPAFRTAWIDNGWEGDDPLMRAALSTPSGILVQSTVLAILNGDVRGRALLQSARDNGIGLPLLVLVDNARGKRGAVSLCRVVPYAVEDVAQLAALALDVLAEARAFRGLPNPATGDLTADDMALLRALARGGKRPQLAADLGLSADGLEAAVAALLAKLGALTEEHAIAIAMRRGLID
jgi:DNA-binding CsgD family transcriptional regulator